MALGAIAVASLGYAITTRLASGLVPGFREGVVVAERPLSLNPLMGAQDPAVHDVGHLLYRSLLHLDATAYPRPDLAVSYSVSTDGLTYRLPLRPGQQWSDGRSITAADVAATISFLQSPLAADHALSAQFAGVRTAVQGSVIVFTLPAPHASFAATLTQLPVLPLGGLTRADVARIASHPSAPMATSGPYQVDAADVSSIRLSANVHANVKPHIEHVQLQLYSTFDAAAAAFKAGNVDAVLATNPSQRATLMSAPGARAHDLLTFRFVDLLFNERTAGLDDSVVRHAIATAVNRASLIGGALQGTGARVQVDAISEGLPWIATRNPEDTPAEAPAAVALQGDGWVMTPGGVRAKNGTALAFTLTVPNVDPLPAVGRELALQLMPLGVHLTVDVVPSFNFVDNTLVAHTFELALADWDGGPDPDVSSFWRSNALPPRGFYVSGGTPDPFLDQALDSLATATDAQARIAAAADVNRFLADDAPGVFLYTPAVSFVTRVPLRGGAIPSIGGGEARYDGMAGWELG